MSSLCGYTKFSEIRNLPMQNKHLSENSAKWCKSMTCPLSEMDIPTYQMTVTITTITHMSLPLTTSLSNVVSLKVF